MGEPSRTADPIHQYLPDRGSGPMRRLVFEEIQDNDNTAARVVCYTLYYTPDHYHTRPRFPKFETETHWIDTRETGFMADRNPIDDTELSKPSTCPFMYEALPDSDYIRCLNLAPGMISQDVVGHLEVTRLSQAEGTFEAISYTWGSDHKSRTITIDGKPMAVTESLVVALLQARRLDKARLLWADAICINQDDSEEKGHQVQLMGLIYELSRCTLICLGYSIKTWPHEVVGLIRDVNGMMDKVFGRHIGHDRSWDSFPHPEADDALISDNRWQSWCELMLQPWFERGWVVQEAALSPDCLVLLAGREIPWLSILRVDNWLKSRSIHLIDLMGNEYYGMRDLSPLHSTVFAARRPQEAKTLHQCPQEGTTSPFMALTALEVLRHGMTRKLAQPKDRIYAFMEYPTSDGAMVYLQPRYGKGTSHLDVYREFATRYLEQNADLDILSFVEHDEHDDVAVVIDTDCISKQVRIPSFPSWVPCWDRGDGIERVGRAADRKIEQGNQEMALLQGDSILQVKGVIIDAVKYVSKKIDWQYQIQPVEAVAKVVSLWNDFAETATKYAGPHQNRLGVAFLHTLCHGTFTGDWQTWVKALEAFGSKLQFDSPACRMETYTKDPSAQLISTEALDRSRGRRFLVLSRGYCGVSSMTIRVGDACAVIFGTRSPFIVREVSGKIDHYVLVGAAYVESAEIDDYHNPIRMGYDEYCDDWKDWGLPIRDLLLC